MKRRSFIAGLVQAVAAAAVAANLVREGGMLPDVPEAKFDPKTYVGEFRWVNLGNTESRDDGLGRFCYPVATD